MILVTGGARSGKSNLAEDLTKEIGKEIVYIATAIAFDDGMKDRIKKHQNSRPSEWHTIEIYRDFENLLAEENFNNCDTILLDCVTLLVTNILLDSQLDFDKCSIKDIDDIEKEVFRHVNKLLEVTKDKNLILVTNEVGMGLVPSYKLGSIYRDIAGRVNQYLAKNSESVYFMVSGIPMKIK